MQDYLYDSKEIIKRDRKVKIPDYLELKESDIQTVDDIDIYVVHHGEYIHKYNTIVAGFANLDNGSNAIIVDTIYEEAPSYVQKFFLLHEIGHFKNNDNLNMMNRSNRTKRLLGFLRYVDAENAADEYAANTIGYSWSYESLSWILINVKLPILSKIELIRRKNRLRKHCTSIEW